MGKKIPYDAAMKLGGLQFSTEAVFLTPNKYGYRVNVNHPQIKPFFEAYHRRVGVPLHIHLSRDQRLRFEWAILRMMEERRKKASYDKG